MLVVAAVMLATFAITAPLAPRHLAIVGSFIPALQSIFCVNDLITAVLLFSQFSISRSRALSVLASGYLFSAVVVIPFSLTFPQAFAPAGLLGAGLQSTAWLYFFWHFGFTGAVLGYAWLNDIDRVDDDAEGTTRAKIGWSVAAIIGLVVGFCWFVTAENRFLPQLYTDSIHKTPLVAQLFVLNMVLAATTLASLWLRGRSLLDQWLMVVVLALFLESALLGLFTTARFDLGFYAARALSLVTSVVVLVVLIAETTKLDARLARLNALLQHERNNKRTNLAAMAASISNEVRQPLMAIAMNGGAAMQYLLREPADREQARSIIETIVNDSHRAAQIFDDIRVFFKGRGEGDDLVQLNDVILTVLHILREDLKESAITAKADLAVGLSPVIGHRGQLQEVILNLVQNAIEALSHTKDGSRTLTVRTEWHGLDEIAVAVEDSGLGINSKQMVKPFDAFVTSKAGETGLRLAICQLIIERHGGLISTWSGEKKRGALFQFILPTRLESVVSRSTRPNAKLKAIFSLLETIETANKR